jgi:hypothetical protein
VFEARGDQAQWRIVFGKLATMSVGETITHDELAGILPDAAEGSIKGAFYRAVAACETELHRTFASVRGVGYRMAEAREHEGLAKQHHRRARRQLKRSKSKVTSADRTQLTREERARLDALELNLSRQQEMTARLDSRVKTESRERKAADAELSERVDRLAALLERHGISSEAKA